MSVFINPYLCLAFVHEHTGVRFNEKYFNDAEYRHDQDVIINQALHDYFYRYWPEYAPDYTLEPGYSVGVGAAFVIVAALFGGTIKYYDDFHPDCSACALAWVTHPEEVQVPDVRHTRPFDRYLDHYEAMVAKYGRDRVSIPGFQSSTIFTKGLEGVAMHSPLTTAYKLRGGQLFIDMVDRPELAHRILSVVCETYLRIFELLDEVMGLKTDVVFFAACFSSLVSERVWREWELPLLKHMARTLDAKILLHSCGRSTHILNAISELPGLLEAHLGEETDIGLARRLMPDVGIYIVPDSVGWVNNPIEQTRASVQEIMNEAGLGPGRLGFQFVMEQGLAPETIDGVLNTIRCFNAEHYGSAD